MTAETTPPFPAPVPRDDSAALAATVLTTVERQLTRYFAAMTAKLDASLAAAETLQNDVRDQAAQRDAHAEAQQHLLRATIDERLNEVTGRTNARLAEFDHRLHVIASQPVGVSPEELLQIRQAMREDIWKSLAPVTERLDALSDNLRRTDDQAAALVQHVNSSTATLISRIETGDQQSATAAEERASAIEQRLDERTAQIEQRVSESTAGLDQRLTEIDAKANERDDALMEEMTAVDDRLTQQIGSANDRLTGIAHRMDAMHLELSTLATKVEGIDQDAIEELKSKMSSAIGEAMLVRIELDRVVSSLEERFDKQAVRLGEIEGQLSDHMDVSTAVQLDRLDELERAVAMLDPDQFVRKDEVLTDSSSEPVNSATSGADSSMHEQAGYGGSDHLDAGDRFDDSSDNGHSVAASASEHWS